jgi:hypothetical protein
MTTRLLTILARFGTDQYHDADKKIRTLLATTCRETVCNMLIVDNALEQGYESQLDEDTRLIGGDGAAREFSGWDRAVSFLGREIERYDVIHLATAAFDQLYARYLERFDDAIVRLVATRSAAVGHIDYYPYPITAFGARSQHWMRSSYIMMPVEDLLMLGRLASVDRSTLFTGTHEQPFASDAPISIGYQKLITDWLTSDLGTGQGTAWHSRFDLQPTTLSLFQDKALAILNEHCLSIKLRAQGCRNVDVTWLSTKMKIGGFHLEQIPGWRKQLFDRDTDASVAPSPRHNFDLKIKNHVQ